VVIRSLILALVACAAVWSLALADAGRGAPLAIVTGVQGDVQVVVPGSAAPSPVALGANLYEKDELRLGKGGQTTLLFESGQILEVTAAEKPTFTITRDSYRGSGVQRVALGKSGQDAAGSIFETRSRGVNTGNLVFERVRGSEDEVQLARPMDSAVLAANPTFAWTAPAGFKGRLVVTAQDGRKAIDAPVQGTSLTWTGSLPAGESFTWTVAADGETAPEERVAEFKTLSEADQKALVAARADIEKNAPAMSCQLMLGLLYRQAGLYHDAIASFEPLSASNPDNAWLHEELGWLFYQVGQLERSKVELKKAGKIVATPDGK